MPTSGRSLVKDRAKAMCEQCVELQSKIERYQRIKETIGNQITVDRIKALLQEMRAQRTALHPGENVGEPFPFA